MTAPLRALQETLLAPVKPRELGGLFSFHYFQDTEMDRFLEKMAVNGYQPEVFTDSGGFSAFSQGVTVGLDDYARWLLRWRKHLDHYANLDVIGDPRTSLRNQIILERKGLRPIPVVHVGTDPEEIRRYHARGYSRMALGGMVPVLTQMATSLRGGTPHEAVAWADRCHEVARDLGVTLHGFGATNVPVLRRWSWGSTDSSSWATGYRFGKVVAFDPLRGKVVWVTHRDQGEILRLAPLLRFYGVNPMDLIRDGEKTRIASIALAGRSHLALARWLRTRPGGSPGYQLFLADSSSSGHDARPLALTLSTPPDPL